MAGEWEKVRFGDLVKITHGWPFKSECFTEERNGRPIIVSIGNFQYTGGFRFESTTVKEYTAEYPEEYELTPGDILLVMTCQTSGGEILGIPGRIPADGNIYLHNQRMGKVVIKDQKRIDPGFVYYLALWSDFNRELCVSASGTKILHTAPVRIEAFEFNLPPLAEQKAIAAVLGALDDKIELNRRMNATLEAMARALFQSWFVDFDPVRAKLDGRPPAALDPATAALFPDSFQDSPLGHIPRGWETSTIGAKLQTALGGTPSRANADYWTDGTVPWINSGKTNEFRIIEPSEWITKEALANSATKLLPKRTTVLAITGATLGQVSITEIECCANQSVVAILASNEFPTEFIYPWIEENIEKLIASQTGGAQQHINKGNVEELVLLCPDQRVVREYFNKAKPLFDQIAANCFQSRTLATLRDTLLPKLLSGEINLSATTPG